MTDMQPPYGAASRRSAAEDPLGIDTVSGSTFNAPRWVSISIVNPNTEVGKPRSEESAAALARFQTRMNLPIVLAALLPLVIVPESGGWVPALVGVVTWLVFVNVSLRIPSSSMASTTRPTWNL